MKSYLDNLFTRGKLHSLNDIVAWWNKGRLLLNGVILFVAIAHMSAMVFLFKNGWIVFLLPFVAAIWVVANLVFSFGLVFEWIAIRVFKSEINFNKVGPIIKLCIFSILLFLILYLSAYHLADL